MLKKFSKMFISLMLISVMLFTVSFPTVVNAEQNNEDSSKKLSMYVYKEWTNENDKDKWKKEDEIFYSDSFFDHSADEYNSHLATLSINMAKYSMNPGDPKSLDDTAWYENQPNRVEKFFEMIGFGNFEANADYRARTDFDTIGVAAASKKIGDYTVIGIVPRSGGYFREWSNNIYMGDGSKSDNMHEGWLSAAIKLIAFLNEYVESKNITGNVKLWIAGYSRGGATANIAAGLLDNKIANNEKIFSNGAKLTFDNLYAYTFEAPQGANINAKNVKSPKDKIYNNIWNVVNPNDFITKFPMSEWGFTRFGTDKFITTEFYDSENFENNRKTFKEIYKLHNDLSGYNGDKLEIHGVRYSLSDDPIMKHNYDGNILSIILFEELAKQIGSRENYVNKYQEHLSNTILKVMSDYIMDIEPEKIIPDIATILKGGTPSSSIVKELCYEDNLSLLFNILDERPDELYTFLFEIGNLMDNHSTNVSVAHLKAQDSIYVDYYNKNRSQDDQLSVVPLRDSADIGRISLFGYNDLLLTQPLSETGKIKRPFDGEKVNPKDLKGYMYLKGGKTQTSEVKKCDKGFAIGFYNYLTEEKVEVFFPVNKTVGLYTKAYSLKPSHRVELWVYRHTLSQDGVTPYRSEKSHHREDDVSFNSNFYYDEYNV